MSKLEYNEAGNAIVTRADIAQIKAIILAELEKEWPKKKTGKEDIREPWNAEDYAVEWRAGYNMACLDCLEVVRKTLQ